MRNPGGAEKIKGSMNIFEEIALPTILRFEGGYIIHPADNGGATNFGITQKSYDEYRTTKNLQLHSVALLTDGEVKEIYLYKYWYNGNCNLIRHPKVAVLHFDSCVNHGTTRAAKFLQEAVDVKVDGVIGKVTLEAVNKYKESGLIYRYFEIREEFYHRIAEKNPPQKVFLKGWLNRLEGLKGILDKMEAK